MLGKIGIAQPKDRERWHAIFPKKISKRFHRPLISFRELPERRKRTERMNNGIKCISRPRFSGKNRNRILRVAWIDVSIQQKTDSLCGGNRCAPTSVLHDLSDSRNRNIFPAG